MVALIIQQCIICRALMLVNTGMIATSVVHNVRVAQSVHMICIQLTVQSKGFLCNINSCGGLDLLTPIQTGYLVTVIHAANPRLDVTKDTPPYLSILSVLLFSFLLLPERDECAICFVYQQGLSQPDRHVRPDHSIITQVLFICLFTGVCE